MILCFNFLNVSIRMLLCYHPYGSWFTEDSKSTCCKYWRSLASLSMQYIFIWGIRYLDVQLLRIEMRTETLLLFWLLLHGCVYVGSFLHEVPVRITLIHFSEYLCSWRKCARRVHTGVTSWPICVSLFLCSDWFPCFFSNMQVLLLEFMWAWCMEWKGSVDAVTG